MITLPCSDAQFKLAIFKPVKIELSRLELSKLELSRLEPLKLGRLFLTNRHNIADFSGQYIFFAIGCVSPLLLTVE